MDCICRAAESTSCLPGRPCTPRGELDLRKLICTHTSRELGGTRKRRSFNRTSVWSPTRASEHQRFVFCVFRFAFWAFEGCRRLSRLATHDSRRTTTRQPAANRGFPRSRSIGVCRARLWLPTGPWAAGCKQKVACMKVDNLFVILVLGSELGFGAWHLLPKDDRWRQVCDIHHPTWSGQWDRR
jgi:hypothetical protein